MSESTQINKKAPQQGGRYPGKRPVFRGLDLRTARGRRIRDLHRAYCDQFDEPDDLIIQAAILKVAKLQVIVERLQNELLKPKEHNQRLGEELVRHENMLRRSKDELTALIPKPRTWWEQRQLERDEDDHGEESQG